MLHGDRKDRINDAEPVTLSRLITHTPWPGAVLGGLTDGLGALPDLIARFQEAARPAAEIAGAAFRDFGAFMTAITGEPLPAAKRPGDEVFAGTLNGTGALRVRVAKDASESVIARIVALVAEASEAKAPTQLFIEKIEQRYSIGVVVATLAVFGIPLLFGDDPEGAPLRARNLPLPPGVAGHEGSTIIVGRNGLRLLGERAWRRR
ncbi:hypothetical protein [Saccharopolyspora shandongensis]|uniref:P-type ATPase n=1 Tax=Saccharopolyspora shandongensis TaxID=418495 RepID=UPI003F4D75B2